MLILTRRFGEEISIGDQIRVIVMEVKGNHVKLGIEAPRGIPVYRHEILQKIKTENIIASNVRPEQLGEILNLEIVPRQSLAQKQEEAQ